MTGVSASRAAQAALPTWCLDDPGRPGAVGCARRTFHSMQAASSAWGRLQSVSHPDVFAAGDIASMDGAPRPKSGVFAVRQGKPLADNLRRLVAGQPLRATIALSARPCISFRQRMAAPSARAMASCSTAHGSGAGKTVSIRRFMEKFIIIRYAAEAAPKMAGSPTGMRSRRSRALAMRCGGCGAKVGATVLSRALGAIVPFRTRTSS